MSFVYSFLYPFASNSMISKGNSVLFSIFPGFNLVYHCFSSSSSLFLLSYLLYFFHVNIWKFLGIDDEKKKKQNFSRSRQNRQDCETWWYHLGIKNRSKNFGGALLKKKKNPRLVTFKLLKQLFEISSIWLM